MHFFRLLTLTCTGALLAACGGGSDDTNATYPNGYIQFYNGSPDSATTTLKLTKDSKDYTIGSASFADVTPLSSSLEPATYDYELYYTNSIGDTVTKQDSTVTLNAGEKNLLIMTGGFTTPDFMTVTFSRADDLDDQFKIKLVDLISGGDSYDLYLAASGKTMADAQLVGTAAFKGQTEFKTLDHGSYTLYVTKAGSRTPLYQSDLTAFNLETEYVMVLRSATGPAKNKLALDMVLNTTTVVPLEDVTAPAQVRAYNSINSINPGKIMLGESATPLIDSLAADTLSAYKDVTAGDYRVSLADKDGNLVMRNGLVSLSQGVVKSVVFYQDKTGTPAAITVSDSKTPQVFDFVFNAVNTISDFDQISVYFVKPGYTMDNTLYYINTLNYASQSSMTLPAGEYTVFIVYKDANNNKSLLAQTELTTLVKGSNYLLVAEKDATAASGYKVSLVK